MNYIYLLIGVIFILTSVYKARLNKIPKTPHAIANHIVMILVLMTSGIVMCYRFTIS